MSGLCPQAMIPVYQSNYSPISTSGCCGSQDEAQSINYTAKVNWEAVDDLDFAIEEEKGAIEDMA